MGWRSRELRRNGSRRDGIRLGEGCYAGSRLSSRCDSEVTPQCASALVKDRMGSAPREESNLRTRLRKMPGTAGSGEVAAASSPATTALARPPTRGVGTGFLVLDLVGGANGRYGEDGRSKGRGVRDFEGDRSQGDVGPAPDTPEPDLSSRPGVRGGGMPDAAFHLQPLGPLLAARAQACLRAACSKDQEMKAKPVQKPSPEKKRSRSLRCNHRAGEGEAQ